MWPLVFSDPEGTLEVSISQEIYKWFSFTMFNAQPTSSTLSAFFKLIDIKQMVYACDGSLMRKRLTYKLYLKVISAAYTVMVKECKVSMRLITLDIEKAH